MPKLKFTKTAIDSIPFSKKNKSTYYWDTLLSGFGLYVGTTSKVFIVQNRVNNTTRRIKIGKYGAFTLEQARKKAQDYLYKMSNNLDPIAIEEKKKSKNITLKQAFQEFLNTRKNLKESTIKDYQRNINIYFSDWLEKPITDINKEMVAKRHSKIGKDAPAQANLSMRVLRAILNFAMEKYEDANGEPIIIRNPVNILNNTKAWYRIKPRISVIEPHELPDLLNCIYNLESNTIRDYLLLLLFTGLRRKEGMRLKWSDVNFKAKTFCVFDTKNHEPLLIPLSDFLYDLLKARHETQTNEYVFPGKNNNGHIIEHRRQMAKIMEMSQDGIKFILHDLRRTYITIAESLGISPYTYKQLANHKLPSNDVTARYVNLNLEQKRKAQQQITNYILKKAGLRPKAEIIDFTTNVTK
jgi:integrase